MKGCTLESLLLALVVACTGCRASIGAEPTDSPRAPVHQEGRIASARLPDPLMGIWYPDDREGEAKCRRYRALSSDRRGSDEAFIALVGSLVMTPKLIHLSGEYGEGDFYVVERVEPIGSDAWRVTALLGIDSMPDGQSGEGRVVSRLLLHRQKLQWWSAEQSDGSPSTYISCDAMPRDVQTPASDEKAAGAAS